MSRFFYDLETGDLALGQAYRSTGKPDTSNPFGLSLGTGERSVVVDEDDFVVFRTECPRCL